MKLLLINPYCVTDSITPPLGLGFLSAAVNDIADVSIRDLIRDNIKDVQGLKKILLTENYDLIGFKTLESNYQRVKQYLAMIKADFPHMVTVVGGPQASILRDQMVAYYEGGSDFLISGEGEKSFRKLCLLLKAHSFKLNLIEKEELLSIPGLSTRINNYQITNEPLTIEDISQFKIDWQALKPDSYPPVPHAGFASRFPVTSLSVSRGCPYHCSFCAAHKVMGRTVRYRDMDRVLEEINQLRAQYGIQEFQIIDDNFTSRPEHVTAFCNKLIEG
jgi:radical SAM superfamily enzyme YgiQ (UPF0313 family)